ncbi:thioredoxin-like protein [Amniculicola lignicola CBS 123094]|uniref:Thioredoxin-like protein n=1 Tax=Amniculicola lignicola CBS 123094 TaxID=1392246 RepID=A0A6A5WQQ0_9PLEO|nr:thioredoxin-like protein [Amniculicola lignicola CBS 123094]
MPTEISSPLHLRTLLSSTDYVVVDFYASWCPPCKAIAPFYGSLDTTNSAPGKLQFVKVNVDEQQDIARQYGITAMPTFLVLKGKGSGKVEKTIRGADTRSLKGAVDEVVKELRNVEIEKAREEARREKEKEKEAEKAKEGGKEEGEEKTVSGSYGMIGGNNWKMSLT